METHASDSKLVVVKHRGSKEYSSPKKVIIINSILLNIIIFLSSKKNFHFNKSNYEEKISLK